MAFTPDGKHLITAGAGGSITKWDSKTGELLCRFIGHTSSVAEILVFPDGRRLASVCKVSDNTVRIWYLDQGNELLSLTHPLLKGYRLPKLATSSGGARLVLSMPGRTDAIIWDIASEGQIEQWQAEEEVDVN